MLNFCFYKTVDNFKKPNLPTIKISNNIYLQQMKNWNWEDTQENLVNFNVESNILRNLNKYSNFWFFLISSNKIYLSIFSYLSW